MIGGGVLVLPPAAGVQAVAVAVHFEDVDVVGEPVEQCASQALRAEDAGPLVEGQVAGHQYRTSLVAPAEDLEQHSAPVVDSGT